MILPAPCSIILPTNACASKYGARRLTAIVSSHFSTESVCSGSRRAMPALLTRMSTVPNAASACSLPHPAARRPSPCPPRSECSGGPSARSGRPSPADRRGRGRRWRHPRPPGRGPPPPRPRCPLSRRSPRHACLPPGNAAGDPAWCHLSLSWCLRLPAPGWCAALRRLAAIGLAFMLLAACALGISARRILHAKAVACTAAGSGDRRTAAAAIRRHLRRRAASLPVSIAASSS